MRSAKSSAAAQDAFRAVVPGEASVTVRPMFGSVAAFAGGQMFMCLFADALYFRLGEADRTELLSAGGGPLEPMPGRPMREYVAQPDWQSRPDVARGWAARSLDYALRLPPRKR